MGGMFLLEDSMAVGGQPSGLAGEPGTEGADKSGHGSGAASLDSGERGGCVRTPGVRGGVAAKV